MAVQMAVQMAALMSVRMVVVVWLVVVVVVVQEVVPVLVLAMAELHPEQPTRVQIEGRVLAETRVHTLERHHLLPSNCWRGAARVEYDRAN